MPLANKLELEQALRARLLVNSISSKDTKHSIVNRTKRLFKKKPSIEVNKQDKFGNFKMYEQFFDLPVGDIRHIPNLNETKAMFKEYLKNWSHMINVSDDPNITSLAEEKGQFTMYDSFERSSDAIQDTQKIEQELLHLSGDEARFLVLPLLSGRPLHKEEKELIKDTTENEPVYTSLTGAIIQNQNNKYLVTLVTSNDQELTIRKCAIDQDKTKELANLLGTPLHSSHENMTTLVDKFENLRNKQEIKETAKNISHSKKFHFLLPQLYYTVDYIFYGNAIDQIHEDVQKNGQIQDQKGKAIDEQTKPPMDYFNLTPATQQNNHKRLMNEFHYAALKRMNQLQYSEDLLHSMVIVHNKTEQVENMDKNWKTKIEDTILTTSQQRKSLSRQDSVEVEDRGIYLAELREPKEIFEKAEEQLKQSRGIVLPNEVAAISRSLQYSKYYQLEKNSIVQELSRLMPGDPTSFLVTSHDIQIKLKDKGPHEKQNLGCVIRKNTFGNFIVSVVDPTGYYQKRTQVNGLLPCVHEFEISKSNLSELAQALNKSNDKNKSDFILQRDLSLISNGGKVTDYIIDQSAYLKSKQGFHHFSAAVDFVIFSSTMQLGRYVYINDLKKLSGKNTELANNLGEERALKIAYPEHFAQKKVKKTRASNSQIRDVYKNSIFDQERE
ncbi:TPA: hypothetical protein ACF39M_001697 [Enterococcus hirae]